MNPTKNQSIVLKQICELIPRNLVSKLAKKYEVDKRCRQFSAWSHVVSMMFIQLSHAISLNDVCDTLRNHRGSLGAIRRASAPSRNGLSHANKVRNADMAEALFWEVLTHLQAQHPQFGKKHRYSHLPRRFKRMITIVDSTTIQLVSNCMDWAKHRRRKAAAKCHLRLNLQTFLPQFAIVKEASTHDSSEARTLCAGIKPGEIVVFDKAYVDYDHLCDLDRRQVFWVTRAKSNMSYHAILIRSEAKSGILRDEIVRLYCPKSKDDYPHFLRLVTAEVELDGKLTTMTFLTNNLEWAPRSICDLYKSRWAIEVFFKHLKQTLQLADFLGYSAQAVRWQVWTALLTYVLLRFLAFMSKWTHSFTRLLTVSRGVLWSRFPLIKLLKSYGTAHGPPRLIATPSQAYLPGMTF